MARYQDREKAIALRLAGKSYSQIKEELNLSKSTLSGWLHNYPLSDERIRQLRDWSEKRIENFRGTMRSKREKREQVVFEKTQKEIGTLSDREFFIAGLFLYWAEGTKMARYTTALTNTDPAMLRFFILWLQSLGVKKEKMKARLHLYTDMNIEKQIGFWAKELQLPRKAFRQTYVKQTNSEKRKNYKGRFGYGTCSVWFGGRDISDKVLMGVKALRSGF